MICDLAETYNIYDYKRLPATLVASFAANLHADSRIKMKLEGREVAINTLLLAAAVDRLTYLLWAQTEDGAKGRNRPKQLVEEFTTKKEPEVASFKTGEEFEERRRQLLEGR